MGLLTVYETPPLDRNGVTQALTIIQGFIPLAFRPTVYGVLVPAPDGEEVKMRLYLADRAGHITTWLVSRQIDASNITPGEDLVDTTIYLTPAGLDAWAAKTPRAPAAASH